MAVEDEAEDDPDEEFLGLSSGVSPSSGERKRLKRESPEFWSMPPQYS